MTKHDEVQNEAVEKGVEFYKTNNKGYYDLCMRFGKIYTVFKLLRRLYDYDCTILVAFPNNSIRDEWQYQSHKWGYVNPNITYVNFSSLHKYKDKIFDFFCIDEMHAASHLERSYCHQIMTNSSETKTLGLSGTISNETKGEWGLKEIAKYTTIDGISDGIIADYSIEVHLVDLDNKITTKNKAGKPKTEKQRYDGYSWIIAKKRKEGENTMYLALARNRLSLSSIGKLNYVKKLLKTLENKRVIIFTGLADVADNIGIASYHSKSTSNINFIQFQAGIVNQLALAEIGRIGVSFKNLDYVIMLNPVYNQETMAQTVNRAIQLDYKDKCAQIIITCINEEPEIKKVQEGLGMLDKSKIIWKK